MAAIDGTILGHGVPIVASNAEKIETKVPQTLINIAQAAIKLFS